MSEFDMSEMDVLAEWIAHSEIAVANDFCDGIAAFKELLYLWNKKHNLTRIAEQDFERLHIIDSISVATGFAEMAYAKKVLDIGTGAGFPGIPLALAFPETSFTLVDKSQKRIVFLEQVIASLGLKNVQALRCRLEDLANDLAHREAYSYVTSRALAPLVNLLPLAKPFCPSGGALVFLKSQSVYEELASVPQGMFKELGLREPDLIPYRVPGRAEDDIVAVFRRSLIA